MVFRFNALADVALLYVCADVAGKVLPSVLASDDILCTLAAVVACRRVVVVPTKNLILNCSRVRNEDLAVVPEEAIDIKRVLGELLARQYRVAAGSGAYCIRLTDVLD